MSQIKAVLYARYSSDNQRDESIDAQLRAMEEYAGHKQYTIINRYIDRAKSATTDRRPEFQKMIEDSASGHFNVVLVHKLDRFSRDKYDSATYKRKLRSNGVQVFSVLENLDNSPESIILESVIEGMAEYYSANLAREVRKGQRETALQCKHTGGIPPTGYDVDPKTKQLILNPDEAPIVQSIFELYNLGYGYLHIVNELNAAGFKTKLGRPFGKNSIRSILCNEKYCGVYIFNRAAAHDYRRKRNNHLSKPEEDIIRIEGGCPQIVTREVFDAAQARMKQNRHGAGRYKAKEPYLLSGLCYCGECGHAMTGNTRYGGKNKQRYVGYRCSHRVRTKQCDNKELRKEYLEGHVLDLLEQHFFTDEAIASLVNQLNTHLAQQNKKAQGNLPQLQKKLDKLQRQTDNIVQAISDGLYQAAMKDKLTAIEEEKNEIQLQMTQHDSIPIESNVITEKMLRDTLYGFKSYIQENNTPEILRFIQAYVERVDVDRQTVKVTFKVAFSHAQRLEPLRFSVESDIKAMRKKYHVEPIFKAV